MLNVYAKVGTCLVAGLVSLNAFAGTSMKDDVGAGRMHVQITNFSGENCALVYPSPELLHGSYDSLPPQSLMINESKSFDVHQVGFGPDVILNYGCGDNKNVRFEVQQDLAIFIAHKPTVTTLSSHGLKVSYDSTEGAMWFWNSPGLVNISIFPG